MRFYETTIVLGPTSDEASIMHEVDKITQVITGGSGRMVNTQKWGVKRMAYPIQKHTQGTYVHLVYQSPPSVPGKLESMFRINENILRHLTVLVEGALSVKRTEEPEPSEASASARPEGEPESASRQPAVGSAQSAEGS